MRACTWFLLGLAGCSRSGLLDFDQPELREPLAIDCPSSDDPRLPEVRLGEEVTIDASDWVTGPVSTFHWSVGWEDCDDVLPGPTHGLADSDRPSVKFSPGRPSSYRLTLEVRGVYGQSASCNFKLGVVATGLRVEACWDTSTSADLDLYLHSPRNMDPFFEPTAGSVLSGFTPSTCNPANCTPALRFETTRADFGYPDSPLEACDAGPNAAGFRTLGRCPNPRSGEDDNQQILTGASEVIQVDAPLDGDTFRVMLQNFDNAPATPKVFVYCGGERVAALDAPSQPASFVTSNPGGFGVMWRAADIVTHTTGGRLSCSATPLAYPGSVTVNDPRY